MKTRNLSYNLRHRKYGYSLAMDDIDCMEWNTITDDPVAIVETKHGNSKTVDLTSKQIFRQLKVANRLEIPFFVLVYYIFGSQLKLLNADDPESAITHVQFYLIPVNQKAIDIFPVADEITERKWIEILHELRGEDKRFIHYEIDPYDYIKNGVINSNLPKIIQ